MPLQIGTWTCSMAGQHFQLEIKSVDSAFGNVVANLIKGTVVTPFIGGLWDESAQKLALWLAADAAGVSSPAVMFTGYLFTDTENLTGVVGSVIFTLAGQIEHFALLDPLQIGLSQRKTVFGWYAQIGTG